MTRGKMMVKKWMLDQKQNEAARYNMWFEIAKESRTELGIVADEDGFVTVILDDIIKETEKAVQVVVATGDIVGSSKGFKAWFPKSQIKMA